jgi:predicted PurR-regulated permease PerM
VSAQQWWQMVAAVAVGVVCGLGLCLALSRVAPVLVLFALGLMIARLLDPLLDRLERWGLTRLQAAWLVSLGGVLLLAAGLAWLVPRMVSETQAIAQSWPTYAARAAALAERWEDWLLRRFPAQSAEQYKQLLADQLASLQAALGQRLPQFLQWLTNKLVKSLSWLVLLGLLVVVAFHFMLVIDQLRAALEGVLPEPAASHVSSLAARISAMLGQYFQGLLTTAFLVGLLSVLGLGLVASAFGTRYWLLLGLAAGFLYVIPWLGGASALLLATFFGYTTADQSPLWAALASFLVVVGVNQLGDVLIMPYIVGRRLGLHPLLVLFGILSAYPLFGLVGVIFATPAMMSLKIILAHFLPVRGLGPQERAPRQPLHLDMPASLRELARVLRLWGDRLGQRWPRPEPPVGHPPDQSEGDQ